MELKNVGPMVLMFVLIGVLVAVGIIVFNSLAYSTFYPASANETIASVNASSTKALSNGNLTGSVVVYNTTGGIITPSYYVLAENASNGNQAYFYATANNNASMTPTVRVILGYKNYNTQSNTVSTSIANAIDDIPNVWLGLIVTIAILGLLIFIIVESFGLNGQMKR